MTPLADNGLDFARVGLWLNDPANWTGNRLDAGILTHIQEHLTYSGVAVGIALVIALPLGLLIGHTGRGAGLVGGLANGLRAIPTLGFIFIMVIWLSPHIHGGRGSALPYLVPAEIVLTILAIPPILTNTYAGVQNVDPAVRDAAQGMGMTGSQVVRQVEFPVALPLILSGVRSAALQVIATATVLGYLPFVGGLGRLLIDGLDQINDPYLGYPKMVSGAILVALLALSVDLLLIGVQRLVVSPGVSGRFSSRGKPDALTAALTEAEPVPSAI